MAIPLNHDAQEAKRQIVLDYLRTEKERRAIREAVIRARRRQTIKLVKG